MRLVTRGDLDGLTCAVLISQFEDLDEFLLVHPQAITDREVEIRSTDILANVPHHPDCGMWFDHHAHTAAYERPPLEFVGAYGEAPSAARLVYEYYGGKAELGRFDELVCETDRFDSADLTAEDITDPQGYIRIGFTLDSRTGFDRYKEYVLTLFHLLRREMPVEAIVEQPTVVNRWQEMQLSDDIYRAVLREQSRVDGNVVVTDLRSLDRPPVGNRFMVYVLFPEVNVSVRVHWGPSRSAAVAALGHSIFNRTCNTDVGELAARYGGGGHPGAGSIPLPSAEADRLLSEIVEELKRAG